MCPSASIIRVMSRSSFAAGLVRSMTGVELLSSEADTRPILAQHDVLILVAPFALEPRVVDEVTSPLHPEPLHQRNRWGVAAIGSGDDAVELERSESEIDHGACGFGRESVVLVCRREGVADFSDAGRRPDNEQCAIAGEGSARFDFGGELKPFAGNPGTMAALLSDEFRRFGSGDRFP